MLTLLLLTLFKKYRHYFAAVLIVIIGTIVVRTITEQFEKSNFQAAVTRAYRKVALKIEPKPPSTVFLPIKFYKQEHALSCEAATLKMALAYRNVEVREKELIEKIGFDKTPRRNGIWGDPQKAFVGNIDGKMMIDGYGVYNRPLERVANEYRYAISLEGASIEEIVRQLQFGNPVIIWSYVLNGKPYSWKTPEGNDVKAVYGEHTKIVQGFSGDAKNPTGFFLLDPIYGEVYEKTEDFVNRWNALGNLAVIVF